MPPRSRLHSIAAPCWSTLARALPLLVLPLLGACEKQEPPAPQGARATQAEARAAEAKRERALAPALKKWVTFEAQQVHPKLELSQLGLPDVEERRLLSRSIARLASPAAHALRAALLVSEDATVAGWAAFGIGLACEGREEESVRLLVLRAAIEPVQPAPAAMAFFRRAVADAVGRCGGQRAEASLVAWLATDFGEEAANGLMRLGMSQGTLAEPSLVALLANAEQRSEYLAPFARIEVNSGNVCKRLLSLVQQLAKSGALPAQLARVRALSACSTESPSELVAILLDARLSVPVRAEALRALAKLGDAGQKALLSLLQTLQKSGKFGEEAWLLTPEFGLARGALEGLQAAPEGGKPTLQYLSELALRPGEEREPGPAELRKIALRCGSAALLARANSESRALQACGAGYAVDVPELATLTVLERAPRNQVEARLPKLLSSQHLLVRERALELLGRHPEMAGAESALSAALGAKNAGEIGEAARALSAHARARASTDPGLVSLAPKLAKSLNSAFLSLPPEASEARAALMESAAAYGILSFIPEMEKVCLSSNYSLRKSAERQLRLMGERDRSCNQWKPDAPPSELAALPQRPLTVQLETDVGPLRLVLDPSTAPLAVARLAQVVRKGAWNGIRVHRAVTGFIVQFGDPDGDGYGGAAVPPLHSELSPIPFGELHVGMSHAGRDTGTSQVFVTLAPAPHLTGEFAWVGRAEGPFSALTAGDRIKRASISEAPGL